MPGKASRFRVPRWLRRSVAAILLTVVLSAAAAAGYVAQLDLPPDPAAPQASVLYYRDGRTVLARIGLTDRTDVGLSRVPQAVQQAFIVAEDRGFRSHVGVSVKGLFRALWTNLVEGSGEGASTITQQYVRNAYLTQDRTVSRKAKEAGLAIKLERRLSKDAILERYLNTIYFGRGAYGIEAAAHAYFGTGVERLTAYQGAVLAAAVKDPYQGDPAVNPRFAQNRWRWIVRALADDGIVPPDAVGRVPYPVIAPESATTGAVRGPTGLTVDRVEDELTAAGLSRQLVRTGGLSIVTTIDAGAQSAAVRSIGAALRGQPTELRTALVAVDPADGGVRAYYGGDRGRGFFDDAQAARPPASTFKPIVLAAAARSGLDLTRGYDGSSPRQFRDRGGVPLFNQDNLQCPDCPLDTAMVHSLNTPFYELAERVGAGRVATIARRMGVPATYGGTPTLVDVAGDPAPGRTRSDIALGRYPVAPADLATVYATLAGGGVRADRHFVVSATAASGVVLHRAEIRRTRVLSAEVAGRVRTALTEVVAHDGPVPGMRAAAKTGSQQWADTVDSSDAWTAGWGTGPAVAVWVGRDKPGPIRERGGKPINGNGMPYRIWQSFLAGGSLPAGRTVPAALPDPGPCTEPRPGRVCRGPQRGDLVDRSLATGTWQQRTARLTAALDDLTAGDRAADVAVTVTDRLTGRGFAYRGDEPQRAAGAVKVELLAALLLRAQDAGRDLTGAEQKRATAMMRAGDDAALTRIHTDIGRAAGLRAAGARLDLHDTDPASPATATTTTTNDQDRLLTALVDEGGPLTKQSRDRIRTLMGSVNADQVWGVTAASLPGERTELNNGRLSRSGTDWTINSTGRIVGENTDVAVSVLSRGHRTQEGGIRLVERVAALTRSYLGW